MRARTLIGTLLLIALALCANFAFTQTPQGISYQAVIRDGTGNPITNRIVGLRITLQNASQVPYYAERHTPTSNSQGIITVILGAGEKIGVNTFASIPWKNGDIFIKLDLDPNGGTTYTTLGTSQLQSVPYALFADNAKEVVSLPDAGDEDPIFVVRNKANQIVFAVYQTGVRVNVADTSTVKGAKGGFAVGGLTSKANSYVEYLRITPDSARIYINEITGKGAKGGFAVGGLTSKGKVASSRNFMFVAPDSTRFYIDDSMTPKGNNGGFAVSGLTNQSIGGSANFFNIETKYSSTIKPSQPRLLWYPLKNAFLVGQVLVEDPDSVGTNSFSSGFESKSKGSYSQALGYKAIARGLNSTAIGVRALANQANSFAFGELAQALNINSFAFGTGAQAKGYGSFAFGSVGRDTIGNILESNTIASGQNAFAIGLGASATALNAFSIGTKSAASGPNSTALGFYSNAGGAFALAINGGIATGKYSMAFRGIATGDNSIAFGPYSLASGANSFALGGGKWAATTGGKTYTEARGNYSYAMGFNSIAIGSYAFSLGGSSTARADYSFALGYGLTNNSYRSFVIGQYNDTLTTANSSVWIDLDPLFVIGNGTDLIRSNALTIFKNGDMKIKGSIIPQTDNQFDLGSNTNRWKNIYSMNIVTPSDRRLKINIEEIQYGLAEILKLNPVSFQWKSRPNDGTELGFIAQDVEPIIKEVIVEGNDANKTLGISYTSFIPILTKAIQEQQKMITVLQQENNLLKAKVSEINDLRTQLETIKALLKK